jgi:hypothetical protein
MSPADRLAMLAALGVEVRLAPCGTRLEVEGPFVLVDAARPTLQMHHEAICDFLALQHAPPTSTESPTSVLTPPASLGPSAQPVHNHEVSRTAPADPLR